tara:strand:+ start:1209 stop:1895 length:687 start_codon:yes stop_codon:yes gene_type:complete
MDIKKFNHVTDSTFKDLIVETREDGTRYYKNPSGVSYPSVTTVTGWEKSKFFAKWRRENPEESRRVLKRGNELHEAIEDYLNNKLDESELTPNTLYLFRQLKELLHNIDNVHAQEVPLWSDILKLAGRVDCVAEYNGELSIIDFKGSTREKYEKDIDNYFMQACAYAIMWQERTKTPIKNIVILISCEDGSVQEFQRNPIDYCRPLYLCIDKYNEHMKETNNVQYSQS